MSDCYALASHRNAQRIHRTRLRAEQPVHFRFNSLRLSEKPDISSVFKRKLLAAPVSYAGAQDDVKHPDGEQQFVDGQRLISKHVRFPPLDRGFLQLQLARRHEESLVSDAGVPI